MKQNLVNFIFKAADKLPSNVQIVFAVIGGIGLTTFHLFNDFELSHFYMSTVVILLLIAGNYILDIQVTKTLKLISGQIEEIKRTTNETKRIVDAKLLNGLDSKMRAELPVLLHDLPFETMEQKALWAYFDSKVNDIYSKYLELKGSDFTKIDFETFERRLAGAGKAELLTSNVGFNDCFVSKVELINEQTTSQAMERIQLTIIDWSDEDLRRDTLQNITLYFFKKNVELIFKAYKECKK